MLIPLVVVFPLLAGCHVNEHKNGNNENVSIETPFGNTSIKTNDAASTADIGLTVYPGAVVAKQDNGKDDSAADVNLSFGSFHLGVKAAGYQSADAEDKVLAFYRKDLARYGDVIECQHDKPVGQPTHTTQGLTCSDHGSVSHSSDESKGLHLHGTLNGQDIDAGSTLELRAGSPQHQHVVSVEKKDGGTKIGLVLLDLPSHMGDHDKDSE
jgi:hypothetical protein